VETLEKSQSADIDTTDSVRAWLRLDANTLISTLGGVGMWSVVVALPTVQAADAEIPHVRKSQS
jgi:hypothetical protein